MHTAVRAAISRNDARKPWPERRRNSSISDVRGTFRYDSSSSGIGNDVPPVGALNLMYNLGFPPSDPPLLFFPLLLLPLSAPFAGAPTKAMRFLFYVQLDIQQSTAANVTANRGMKTCFGRRNLAVAGGAR